MLERGLSLHDYQAICRADIAEISLKELYGLIEVFRVVESILTAYTCQPKFLNSRGSHLNAAGNIVAGLAENFGMRLDMASERLLLLRPANEEEREDRARLLVERAAATGEDLAEIAALAASVAAPGKH